MLKIFLTSKASHSALVVFGLFSVLAASPALAKSVNQEQPAPVTTTAPSTPVTTTANKLSSVTFGGTDSGRSASALFNLTNNVLSIALNNTSKADSLVPTDILTGLFFDVGSLTLNPISAMLGSGSTIYGGSPNTTNVGGEWGFGSKLAIGNSTYNYGMSAAGLGLFGPKNRFDTSSNLSGTENVGGLDYGIVTAGDNQNTGNGGLDRDLIKGSVIFSFGVTNLPSGFDLAKLISNVRFQYGTNTTEPSFAGSLGTPPVAPPVVVAPPIVVPPAPPVVVAPPIVVPPAPPVVVAPPIVVPPAPPVVVAPPIVVPPVAPPVVAPPVVIPPVEPEVDPTTKKVPEPSAIAAILLTGAAILRSRKSARLDD